MKAMYCKRGHRLTKANRAPDGRCRICRRKFGTIRMRAYRKRKRAEP
jgi:hypothetical protein